MLPDLRYSVRTLLRKPGFAVIAVVTMALGIAATTAIFSVADAILWKALPLPDAGRLAMVFERRIEQQGGWIPVSPGNFTDWRAQSRFWEHFGVYRYASANLTGAAGYPDDPQRLESCEVSPDFFAALGVRPMLGRTFTANEAQPGSDQVVVLSYRLWVERFGSDPGVLGKTLQIDGRNIAVIGVMPAQFDFPPTTELWMPLAMPLGFWQARPAPQLFAVARLKPGITAAQAGAEMEGIAQRLDLQHPQTNRGWRTTVIPVREFLMGGLLKRYTWMLLGVVGFVLLIACANITNLQFARATVRAREMAVRAALGATRGRMIRQLLYESVVLALAGAVLGALAAGWGVDLIRSGVPEDYVSDIPNWSRIRLDGRALGFTAAVAVISGILSGLAPAFQSASRGASKLGEALKATGHTLSSGRSRLHLRNVLVAADLALMLVLLAGAGLMIKGLVQLINREQNARPETLLTLRINLPEKKYGEPHLAAEYYDRLLARIETLPGVSSAAVSNAIPHSGSNAAIRAFEREGAPAVEPGEQRLCEFESVSPAYMRTLRIALRSGRGFRASDGMNTTRVAIISERMARRFWPGEEPVGKRIRLGDESSHGPWMMIVGVATDVIDNSYDREPRFTLYVPYAQAPMTAMHVVIRTLRDPAALSAGVQTEVRALDREQPVYHVRTMSRLLREEVSGLRFIAILMSVFGSLALVLASVGVYGVMSLAVSERTWEIGMRLALGAGRGNVLALVVRRAMWITAAGVTAGLGAAIGLARVLAGLVFGVSTTDGSTFATIVLLLAAVALVASYIPARRAMRVDPIAALRHE